MKFVELLEDYNVLIAPEGHHHTTSGWVQFDCPFCGKGTGNYHMGYNIAGGFTNCWRCGSHSIFSVILAHTGLPYNKVKKLVNELDDIAETYVRKTTDRRKTVQMPADLGPLKYAHRKYLEDRNFNPAEIQQLWQIRGITISAHLSWRLFIPIYYNGKLVSWTTRSLTDKGQRYISAKAEQETISHKNILYGMDYVRHSAVIVEGPLDAWAIGPGAVATFGTAFTMQQVSELIKIPKRMICFDNNYDAQRQATKLLNLLGPFDGETLNVVLDADDPAEAKLSDLKKLRKFLK